MPEAQKDKADKAAKPEPQDKMAGLDPLVGVAETLDSVTGPRTAEEHRRAIEDEYGEFVAVAAITHDGARAYNIGDVVPKANVERWGYLDAGLVARQSTKAAAAAGSVATGEPAP